MQLIFDNYIDEEYQKYKNACLDNHKDCMKIDDLKTIEQIKSCQVRCQYSYEYA